MTRKRTQPSMQVSKPGELEEFLRSSLDGAPTARPTSVTYDPGATDLPPGQPRRLVFPDRTVVKVQVDRQNLGAAILIHALSRGMEELSKMGKPDWSSLRMSIQDQLTRDGEPSPSWTTVMITADVIDHDVPMLKDAGTHARLNKTARL